MNRTETLHAALATGTGYEWSENHVYAHGRAGVKNPLGAAINHLMTSPNRGTMNLAVHLLSGELQKHKIGRQRDAVDIARDSLVYFLSWLCPACMGTGVKNIEQETCQICGGSGKRQPPDDENIKSAVSIIKAEHERMELQLQKRLGGYWQEVKHTYVVHAPEPIDIEC